MTYNDLIQSFRQYRPEKQYSKRELEDAAQWLQNNPDKIPNHLLQSSRYRPEKDKDQGRLSDARVKEIVNSVITSALPHFENNDYGNGKSGLPSKESTEIGASGISLSEAGQQRYLKESRAYRDAVIRYRKVVGGDVADEFLRTRPTLSQLQTATRGINGASLETIYKKWRAATGQKRR
jgi:hypothetical protein